jgi:hypothetical protein
MLDSDDNVFYIGEQQIKDQEEQSTEIIKIENLQNCDLSQKQLKCKLVKIVNSRGFPNLHFEINEKMYFYGIAGVKADNKIVLRCQKILSGSKLRCNNISTVLPTDFLKNNIQKTPSEDKNKYPKILDKSHPRVYDIDNYDINSFDIGEGHRCPGTEISVYLKSLNKPEMKCKIVKIVNSRGFPHLHFEINGKIYFYGIFGVKSDNTIVLKCTRRSLSNSSVACNNISTVLPSNFLKEIIQKKTIGNKIRYANRLDISDPRVYDLKNYDINSFDIGKGHKCSGN